MITTDSVKFHNPVQSMCFIQGLWVMLVIYAYYASIMLNVFVTYYAQNYAGIIGSSLTHTHILYSILAEKFRHGALTLVLFLHL